MSRIRCWCAFGGFWFGALALGCSSDPDSTPGAAGSSGLGGSSGSGSSESGSGGAGAGGQAGSAGSAGSGGIAGGGGDQAGGTGGSGGASGAGGSGGLGGSGGSLGGSGGSATCDAPDEPPGSAETGECGDFTPCGGELTGAWNITRACADPPYRSYSALCGEGTDTTELIGTLGFAADGTYEARGAFHTAGSVSAACLQSWDRTCGENPFEGCTPSADGCDCDHVGELSEPEAGWTFETEGNVLRLTDGCEVRAAYYCVEGTTLRLQYATDTRVELISAERDTP